MSRLKRGERRDSGLPKKRDTPLKTSLRRRAKRQRFVAVQHYEALPEEAEVEELVTPLSLVLSNLNPGHYKASRLHRFSSALTGDPEENAALPGAPCSRKMSRQVSPAAHTKVPMEQNLSVISGSTTLHSLESDIISSDDDEGEDTCSSTASNSLPSPEVFRKERSNEAPIFSSKEEIPAVLHNKNSTLLDASHAVSIHMHPAPNLSTITDNSAFWLGNNFEIRYNRGSKPEVRTGSSTLSANKAVQSKTVFELTKRTPIWLKKKVWFKNPLTESKAIPAGKLPLHHDSEPFQTSSSVKNVKPEDDVCQASRMDSEEVFQAKVKQKGSTTMTPERAKLFDFSSDSDREAFFQGMRERCDKLWSYPLFPLTAGNTQNCLS